MVARVAPPPVTFDRVDPAGADAQRSMRAYFAELDERFPTGFADTDEALAEAADLFREPAGSFVVMYAADEPIGCAGLQRIDASTAEIKRMWVASAQRGRGLGRRLLDHVEQVAAELGYERIVLDTNDVLTEAIALYEQAGYGSIERYNDNPYAKRWFAKTLSS